MSNVNELNLHKSNIGKWLRRVAGCWQLYVLILPGIIAVAIFHYIPIYGIQIAFKDFRTSLGIWGSHWVGLKHFSNFVKHPMFYSIMRNTVFISLYSIATFPCSVIFALMINEIRIRSLKRSIQMFTYAPHFVSTVVVASMILLFFERSTGIANNMMAFIGLERVNYIGVPEYFYSIYVWSDVWQNLGWGTIIYLAVLANVSSELHEAARIDGASRLQIVWHINLPSILPTVITLLILRTGSLLSIGFEKIYLLQNSLNITHSKVISTYVYEVGLLGSQFSYSTAIGLFNNLINILFILMVNSISKRVTQVGLW